VIPKPLQGWVESILIWLVLKEGNKGKRLQNGINSSSYSRMNAIVELFRTDQVNEAECLSEIQRVIAQVEHLAENHLGRETNNADQFFGITKALDLNADRMIVILTFSKQMIDNAARTEGLVIEEGNEEMDQNYLEPLGRLIAQAKNSKIIAK
jgi:dynactin 1